jgi:phosphoenolpyruvate carboxylase
MSLNQSVSRENYFSNEVLTRYELYNSLFLTLPFYRIKDTGTLLPLFFKESEEGIKKHQKPADIIQSFFGKYVQDLDEDNTIDLLFRFIQYIERQVVLFDAVEDSAFEKLNPSDEHSSLRALMQKATDDPALHAKINTLVNEFSLRLVLTAHPTQFYPGPVLAIINDLTKAIKHNDFTLINELLQQLGKTPFFNRKSPTPVNEAANLAWYLENVFYFAAANIQTNFNRLLQEYHIQPKNVIELGFWPGGDRDGNPNVNTQTTAEVSRMLRRILFRCYYRDFRVVKRRITFRGLDEHINALQDLFYEHAFNPAAVEEDISPAIIEKLAVVIDLLKTQHDGLFVDVVEDLLRKVQLFRCYFASLDIRQDSRKLRATHQYCRSQKPINALFSADYDTLSEDEKIASLSFKPAKISSEAEMDDIVRDTLTTIREVKEIQEKNGELACHRFIISNCQQASDILQLMELFLWNGWTAEELNIDFVPLFETVNDLQGAAAIMEKLYKHPFYKAHLQKRGNKQHIMLGFSDSTKDGGYLMANWSIFTGKVSLCKVAEEHNIQLAFFDGRGGPPARGGGKTHRFYASMGREIANKNIQLTVQGQTISSQFGSISSAEFNIEQLINAAVTSGIENKHNILVDEENYNLLQEMSQVSYEAYTNLRNDPRFMDYLIKFSPLTLLAKLTSTISSRPVKRNSGTKLKLDDLRAISFVTSWSQLKQNVPGFYGVGTALKQQLDKGNWEKIAHTYKHSGYFRTIIDNCIMSMSKSDFGITAYFAKDKDFGAFWQMLNDEFELSKLMLQKLTGQEVLMENYPIDSKSIAVREKIILPLVLIQHYAIQKLQGKLSEKQQLTYEKLAIRTVYGIVNAGRNLV